MANISGPYRPTTFTKGVVGDIFTNTNTGDRYRCTNVHTIRSNEVVHYYEWIRIITSSSSGGTSSEWDGSFVDETTGDKYVLKVNNGKLTMEEV